MCSTWDLDTVKHALAPADVAGKRVLEAGALDVNGSYAVIVSPRSYGVDFHRRPLDYWRYEKEDFEAILAAVLVEDLQPGRASITREDG